MAIVSMLECSSPVSLRSCGSTPGSLLYNRKLLQCRARENRRPSSQADSSLHGGSASGLCISPLQGRAINTPQETGRMLFSSCSKSSTSLDTDQSIDEQDRLLTGSTEPYPTGSQTELAVIGRQPKIRSVYELVPLHMPTPSPRAQTSHQYLTDITSGKQTPEEVEFDDITEESRVTSPDNPPPSPINDYPSLDSFVIGGKHIKDNFERTSSSRSNYGIRDFTPGVVRQTFQFCPKAADQEAKYLCGKLRCDHSYLRENCPDCGGCNSHGRCCCSARKPWNTPINTISRIESEEGATFLDKYGDRLGNAGISVERRQSYTPGQLLGSEFLENGQGHDSSSTDSLLESSDTTEDKNVLQRLTLILKASKNWRPTDNSQMKERNSNITIARTVGNVTHLSDVDGMLETEERVDDDSAVPEFEPGFNKNHDSLDRRWSSVWPFIGDTNLTNEMREKFVQKRKSLMSKASESVDAKQGFQRSRTAAAFTNLVGFSDENNQRSSKAEVKDLTHQNPPKESQSETSEMSDQVDLEKESSLEDCIDDQTLNTDINKVRRQYSDTFLPSVKQFCFEAVIDKRYNRWKRRRRKKKEQETRKSQTQSRQSDSEEENKQESVAPPHDAVEEIIDRMYEEIHGQSRTPNGTYDTPRVRNRRRRRESTCETELKPHQPQLPPPHQVPLPPETISEEVSNIQEAIPHNGDACSVKESDASKKTKHCSTTAVEASEISNSTTDELCTGWSYMDSYKQTITNSLTANKTDQNDKVDYTDWLPPIGNKSVEHIAPDAQSSTSSSPEKGTAKTNSSNVQERRRLPFKLWAKDTNTDTETNKKGQRQTQSTSKTLSNNQEHGSSRGSGHQEKGDTSATGATRRQNGDVTEGEIGDAKGSRSLLATTEFKVSLEPINLSQSSRDKASSQHSRELKENLAPSETLQRQGNSLPNIRKWSGTSNQDPAKSSSMLSKQKEQSKRPKNCPNIVQPLKKPEEKAAFPKDISEPGLIYRDYYLRSMYKTKTQPTQTMKEGGGKTATVKKAETTNQTKRETKPKKQQQDERPVSNLSFTRPFTFSSFLLPQMHKDYNMKLMQKAVRGCVETRTYKPDLIDE